jgi:uncharacterized protein (DUF433 family)/predicted nuclease of predicted toxin-antitoxin system
MTQEQLLERISIDPNVCCGQPCIRGTRIYISIILDALAEGLTADQIIDHYPSLTIDDVRAALVYAAELSRENIWTKLKLDENLSRHLKPVLESVGFDVQTVADEGLLSKPDRDIAAASNDEGRILLTLALEFADMRKYPPGSHPGIILFRPRSFGPLSVNRFVEEFLRDRNINRFSGCVVAVEPDRVRIRRPSHEDEYPGDSP